jgi:hypothetical protein
MCTVLLPPGDNPIAVNKYIISAGLPTVRGRLTVRRVVNVYFVPLDNCAPNVESQRVDDVDTDNIAHIVVYQCWLNYYRNGRINHVTVFVLCNSVIR